jgi:phosphoribosylformylglycinamidine (FGAM) synthase-like enzyme
VATTSQFYLLEELGQTETCAQGEKFVREGAHVIVLGGSAMLIGLAGGAASSNASREGSADLDFNSV